MTGLLLALAAGVWLAAGNRAGAPTDDGAARHTRANEAGADATVDTGPQSFADTADGRDTATETAVAPASAKRTAVTDRFPDAVPVAEVVHTPRPDIERRLRLVETNFKYPLIRLDEKWRLDPASGRWALMNQRAMVGDHAIVRLEPGTPVAQLEALSAKVGAHIRRALAFPDTYLVAAEAPTPETVDVLVEFFASGHPGIRYAEPDHLITRAGVVPNDPSYNQQWHLPKIGMPKAWTRSTGSHDVVVAIIDTGVDYNHSDLAANIWINPGEPTIANGLDSDGNGYIDDIRGWNFFANNNNPMDFNSHGTHVAGIIGAVGNNAAGIAGINWNVSIMPLRVFSDTGQLGAASDITDAFHYATTMRIEHGVNVRVINASWGGDDDVQSIADAIADSEAAGILVVCAAGNKPRNNDTSPYYPASYPYVNIIAVANTTSTDGLAGSSNYGAASVHLGAPGTAIYSTGLNGGYTYKTGTSMAAPMVAGVAALIWSIEPDLTVAEVKGAILAEVDPLPALSGKTVTGGRLNAERAVHTVTGQPPVVTPVGGPQQATDGSGLVIWNLDVSDPDQRAASLTLDFSTNATDWVTAPVVAVTATTGQPDLAPHEPLAVTGIVTGDDGIPITNRVALTWASRDGTPPVAESTTVRLRAQGWDGVFWSAPTESALFTVDNVPPSPDAALITFQTSPFGDYVVSNAVLTAWDGFADAGVGIKHYYVSLADGGGSTNGLVVNGTEAVVKGLTDNVENTVYVWAADKAGNIGPAASATVLALSPDDDYDGNGMINLAEEIAGTDATDSASTFQLLYERPAPPQHGIVLHWQSISNRFYTLRESSTPAGTADDWPIVPAVSNLPGTGGMMSYTGQTATARFYRLEVAP